ncbi:MAG TPA: DUF4388 domain-containing protein [Patescibacteria group bacterium]|nr:DUF4388 domain-containing protein [Patescibacteria group bacterium]
MNGHYTSHYLAEVLRDLYFQECTGSIEVKDPTNQSVTLHFDRGMLFFGEGTNPTDRFPAHLGASGLLPPATLTELGHATSSSLEVAARLVSKGVLTKEALDPTVRGLVESCVIRAFSWPSGTYEFTAREAGPSFFDPDILFTFECILRGIAKMAYFAPLREILLKLPGKLKISEKLFLPVHRLALKPRHGYILSRIDGSMKMEEIAMVLPPDEEDESLQFIYGLAVLGIVEFNPPLNQGPFSLRQIMQGFNEASSREARESALIESAAARILGQGNAEVLGVEPDAQLPVLQRAFEEAKSRYSRSRFSERVREKYKMELGLIENRLTEAFLKLQVERLERAGRKAYSDVTLAEINPDELSLRREMVKTEAQATQEQNIKLADRYYQKAREYLHEKDYHNCIQFCRLAIKFNTQSAPFHALMAEALAKNPNTKWQKMAEDAYQTACDLDPWNAEYRVALGVFYQNQGLGIRARKQFEKALEILPTHAVAKAALKGRGR